MTPIRWLAPCSHNGCDRSSLFALHQRSSRCFEHFRRPASTQKLAGKPGQPRTLSCASQTVVKVSSITRRESSPLAIQKSTALVSTAKRLN